MNETFINNPTCERSLISICLNNSDLLIDVEDNEICSQHFIIPAHRHIFTSMMYLYSKGIKPSPLAILEAITSKDAKEEITKKILEVFPSAFQYDKEIRIPWTENGEQVQIKLTLTAAKVMVNTGGDAAVPGGAAEEIAAALNEKAGESWRNQ